MSILSCYLLPHPAIMIEEVGGRETQKVISSVKAADTVGKEIQELSHGYSGNNIPTVHFYDAICVYDFPLRAVLQLLAPQVKMKFDRDDIENEI